MIPFIEDYLVRPMQEGTGYNIFTTILIAALLLLAVWILSKSKRKISLSDLLPFIVGGAAIRSLEDACFYPCGWPVKLLFITPGIWIAAFLAFILAGKLAPKKWVKWIGWLIAIPNIAIAISRIRNWNGLFLVLSFFAIGAAAVFWLLRAARARIPRENSLALLAHVFDGASTYAAVKFFGYSEEHVFARWLIGTTGGPASFFIVKIAGILAILLILGNMKLNATERTIALAAIIALGLGPGIRNTLSLAMGV